MNTYIKEFIKFLFLPYRIYTTLIVSLADHVTGPTELIAKYLINKYQNEILRKIFKGKPLNIFPSPIVPPQEQEEIKLYILKIIRYTNKLIL